VTKPRKTNFVHETEPGIGLYKYNPQDETEEGVLRYLPGNPQGRQPGSAVSLGAWMKPITTSERGRELSERSREKKQQALEDGIREQVEEGLGLSLANSADALKYIAKAQTELALAPDSGMPSVKAAELLLKAVDALPDPRYNFNQTNTQIILNIDGAALAKLEEQIDILEAEYIERKDTE
jgi:hypothetical protein